MYKTPTVLVLVGFAVVYFTIPFLGIDILIDAVGFLLVFNGLLALKRQQRLFLFAPQCSMVLVVAAAAQLFASGWLLMALGICRVIAECVLYWQMMRGFKGLAVGAGVAVLAKTAYVVLGLCVVSSCFGLPGTLTIISPLLTGVFEWLGRAALLLWLFVFVKKVK